MIVYLNILRKHITYRSPKKYLVGDFKITQGNQNHNLIGGVYNIAQKNEQACTAATRLNEINKCFEDFIKKKRLMPMKKFSRRSSQNIKTDSEKQAITLGKEIKRKD